MFQVRAGMAAFCFFAGLHMPTAFAQSDFFSPVTDRLYENSEGSPLLRVVEGAQNSIDIEIYTMKDANVIQALTRAMARGVKLRILQTNQTLDNCHVFEANSEGDANCQELKRFVDYVRTHGGEYLPFSETLCGGTARSCFQHGKILIADQKVLLLSTGNFDPTSLCDLAFNPGTCNRDFTLLTSDVSVIASVQRVFNLDRLSVPFNLESVLNSASAARLTVSPDSLAPITRFLQSAKKQILIENQYLKDPSLNQALIEAAKRGIDVRVMVASASAFGKLDPVKDSSAIREWKSTFTQFDEAGVKSRVFTGSTLINGKPGYLHAKVILIDDARAWVGSVNGSTESLTENREYGLFTQEPQVVQKLGQVLSQDFSDPHSESWAESLDCAKDPAQTCRGVGLEFTR